MKVNDATPSLERLANCSAAVRSWFLWNDLQLNADKSEAVILGTAPQLRSAATIRVVEVADSRLQVAPKLKSLGVTIDSRLRIDCHAKEGRATTTHAPCVTCAVCCLTTWPRQWRAASWHPGLTTAMLYQHLRRPTTGSGQLGQSRLPARRSNRCKTTSPVTSQAASEATSHL